MPETMKMRIIKVNGSRTDADFTAAAVKILKELSSCFSGCRFEDEPSQRQYDEMPGMVIGKCQALMDDKRGVVIGLLYADGKIVAMCTDYSIAKLAWFLNQAVFQRHADVDALVRFLGIHGVSADPLNTVLVAQGQAEMAADFLGSPRAVHSNKTVRILDGRGGYGS
ncbi:MAG: hypothetical protein AB7G80_04180 [Dongiaceae bacterium]